MKKTDAYALWAFVAAALLFYVVVIRLRFVALPVFFLALGFVSYAWSGRRALLLFLFLLPLVNSTPDLFFNGYPFNYMGIPLFHLTGILCASWLKKERPATAFPGHGPYLLFLALLGISIAFVFLRWSNLDPPALAFLRDTPVAPSLERVSFACIFPVITLALFSLAPWAAFLLRHWRLGEAEVFVALKAGFLLSFLLALAQKWLDPDLLAQSVWGAWMKQVNGGFSDFNAFGFFAGAMFLWQALKLIVWLPAGKKQAGEASAGLPWIEFLFLVVALAAIFLSGCRTAFLFVLAAQVRFLFSKKFALWLKAGAVLLLAALLLVAGGTLGKRLRGTVMQATQMSSSADLHQAVDKISNRRLGMIENSACMIGRFPLSGVGAGNFLFYLKYLRFGEKYYEDLPLNQYLLFFCEIGLLGGLVFLLFFAALLRRLKPGTVRFMLAVMAVALLFNNFFWFPEVLLLFWVVVSQGEWKEGSKWKWGRTLAAAAVLLFIVMNALHFQALHPRTWAREKEAPYDYGFSYPERENGRDFRWSGAAAGMYIHLDRDGRSKEYRLYCGAPLFRFPGNRQVVDVYWRGKLLKRVTFRQNHELPLRIEDKKAREGFLEFRVRPAFSLKKMRLGAESRDLGVQVSGGGM